MLTQRISQKRWQASTALRKRNSFCRKTFGSRRIIRSFDHHHQNYDVQVRYEKLRSLSVSIDADAPRIGFLTYDIDNVGAPGEHLRTVSPSHI